LDIRGGGKGMLMKWSEMEEGRHIFTLFGFKVEEKED